MINSFSVILRSGATKNLSGTARSFATLRMTALTSILLLPTISAPALEIPVDIISNPSGGATVGFVDMEKIFQEFPETEKAKAEYLVEVDKKRKNLLEKELAVKEIKERIDIIKKSLESGKKSPEGFGPTEEAAALTLRQEEFNEQEKQLERERLKAEQELVDYERRRSQAILGRIYVVLQELAEEAQVSVVVDKSHILYGTPEVDLTQKLRDRLRLGT